LDGEIAGKFLAAVLADERVKRLLSNEHFSVDGTVGNFVRRLGMIGAKEPDDAATQRASYP
jgi:hypothetical protein